MEQLVEWCQWLEHTPIATRIRESLWVFPAIETTHLLAMIVLRTYMPGAATGQALSVMSWHGQAPGGPPLHRHPDQDEVFIVDEGEYRFQCGDAQRAELAIRFRDESPLRWFGPVGASMDSSVQIVDPPFEVRRVITPRLVVDSWRGKLFQFEEACPQQLRREVVQQVGELLPPILLCRLSYTWQPTRSGSERRAVPVPALDPGQ